MVIGAVLMDRRFGQAFYFVAGSVALNFRYLCLL
jgi:hypothetical protein